MGIGSMNTPRERWVLWALLALVVLAALTLAPDALASEGGGGGLPYEGPLAELRSSMTGPVAFTLSIVGIVLGFGILIFGGDMNGFFRTLVFLVLLISLLVGAQNFMATFFGRGAEVTQTTPAALYAPASAGA